jgi:hypothetical protein
MNPNGINMVGSSYLWEALAMGKQMDLFDAPGEAERERAPKERLFIAWAFFG